MDLGSYITNEYGILKIIFSHLSAKDLLTASKVCKEWKDVAFRQMSNNNVPMSYIKRQNGEWGHLSNKINSSVFLHFSTNCKYRRRLNTDFLDAFQEAYCFDKCSVFSVVNKSHITSMVTPKQLKIFNERGKDSEAVLILPKMRGVKIEAFSMDCHSTQDNRIPEIVMNSKCLLLIVNTVQNSIELAHQLITSLRNPETLVMAGGVAAKMSKIEVRPASSDKLVTNIGILGLSFSGEKVSAVSEIHDMNSDINQFMEAFVEKVGPLPEGAVRLAFMFICVNRERLFKQEETDIFSKYFPSVPVYGFWSLGEYCIRNPLNVDENHDQRRKRLKCMGPEAFNSSCLDLKFFHEECTTYLMITMKRS